MKPRQLGLRMFFATACAAVICLCGGNGAVAQVTGGAVRPAVNPAQSVATVTLRDGTLLKGRVSSLQNGLIRLETRQLGTLNVPVSSVQSIVYSNSGAGSGNGRGRRLNGAGRRSTSMGGTTGRGNGRTQINGADLQGLMQFIAASPELMQSVTALQEDPEIQAVVRDPAIQRAVQSGNLMQLMKNPKILSLLRNRKLKALSQRIARQYKR